MARYVVGIDLGTTNTVVAYAAPGDPAVRLFEIEQLVAPGEVRAETLLPSLRYHPAAGEFAAGALRLPWSADDEPAIVGSLARRLGAQVPGRLVTSAKSWLSHAAVDRSAPILPWGAPDDVAKEVLGTDATIDTLRDHVFNWRLWPGFGNEGPGFHLRKYRYVRLVPGDAVPIARTQMTVEALPLSHGGGYASTAFLVGAGTQYTAYFGDTGPDAVEKSNALQAAWTRLAPLVRSNSLRGVFIEVSYPDGRPDNQLFGHLTPAWLMRELRAFARTIDAAQPASALSELTVFVTLVKPALVRS